MVYVKDERELVEELSFKYLEKYASKGDIYTELDLFHDVVSDEEYCFLESEKMTYIKTEDLMGICKEIYDEFFSIYLIVDF